MKEKPKTARAVVQAQTIDKCQGDEADAVILSLVMSYDFRSGSTDAGGQFVHGGAPSGLPVVTPHSARKVSEVNASDFVQYPNRVNVGISRARYALVVVLLSLQQRDVIRSTPLQVPDNLAIHARSLPRGCRYALVVVSSDSIEHSMKRAGNRTVWGPLLSLTWQEGGAEEGEARRAFVRRQAVEHFDTVRYRSLLLTAKGCHHKVCKQGHTHTSSEVPFCSDLRVCAPACSRFLYSNLAVRWRCGGVLCESYSEAI